MIEIKVKYKVGDYVTIVGYEDSLKHRVLGYEYLEGRGMRYIVQDRSEFNYFFEYQLQLFVEETTIGFKEE